MTIGLVLGALDLIDPRGLPFAVETLAEGTDLGNPQPIEVAIRHLLQDGSIVEHEGDDNREIALRIIITAPTGIGLAKGVEALAAELYRRNTLTYLPPDGLGAPTVYDVITSSLQRQTDDLAEVKLGARYYSVRLVCEPFGRSETEVISPALAASGITTTLVDAGAATTNWTGAIGSTAATVEVVSGAVGVTTTALVGAVTIGLTRTAAITTSATKYLVVDWKATPVGSLGSVIGVRAHGDGVELERVAQTPSPTAGFTRSWFYVQAASVAVLRLDAAFNNTGNESVVRAFHVDNIDRTDTKPVIGTARQLLRSVEVAGSARTQGLLVVEHATSALGDAMVYTWPDDNSGYIPATRSHYRSGGGVVTSDAALVSGARDADQMFLSIPLNRVPEGKCVIMGRLRSNTGVSTSVNYTIATSASVEMNGTDLIFAVWDDPTVALTGTAWVNAVLGHLSLPLIDVADPSQATLELSLMRTSVQFDEIWLFNTSIGALTIVPCGTAAPAKGGASNRLYLEPATADRARPIVRRGYAADGSDAFYASDASSWEMPEFKPPRVNIFTVTSNATGADVEMRHFPRWHDTAVS